MANIKQSAETAFAIKAEKARTKNQVLKYEVDDLISEKAHERRWKIFNGFIAFLSIAAVGVVAGLFWGGVL